METHKVFKATPIVNTNWNSKTQRNETVIGWNIYQRSIHITYKKQSLLSRIRNYTPISIENEYWNWVAFVKTEKEIETCINHFRLSEKIYN